MSKSLAHCALNHFHLSGHTFWNSMNVPTGLRFTIQISLQQLYSCCCNLYLCFQSQFFLFDMSHLSILNIHCHYHRASCWPVPISLHPKVFSVVCSGSFRFSGHSFSLRWETCYEAFCLQVFTSCLCNPYFVQTWHYILLFIISAPSTYFIHSDYGLESPGIESQQGVRFFHFHPLTCIGGLPVGQGGWRLLQNIRPL